MHQRCCLGNIEPRRIELTSQLLHGIRATEKERHHTESVYQAEQRVSDVLPIVERDDQATVRREYAPDFA